MSLHRVIAIVRWAVAALLLSTGAIKLADPSVFSTALAQYRVLPSQLLAPTTLLVPWLELACGLALLSRQLRGGGWLLAVLLSLSFAIFTGSALWRGLDISCGCFGSQKALGHLPWIAALDVVMLLVSAFGLKSWAGGRFAAGSLKDKNYSALQ